jgi:redox-sensitive bicupin YhaK (pirin superfamily)
MQKHVFRASERGLKDSGWLKSKFVFSFSNFQHPLRSAFGTLQAFNDDLLQPGKGFGIHPHQNMEIISVLLQGKMNHKDSMGYSTELEPGAVQIMSAGKGLFHEEYNIGQDEVRFLQIWIQPKLQNIRPRYQQRTFSSIRNELVTIVSHEEGLDHCWINQNAKISLGRFDEQASNEYHFRPLNTCAFLYTIDGSLVVEGQELQAGDAIGIWDTGTFNIQSSPNTYFIIIETVINQK